MTMCDYVEEGKNPAPLNFCKYLCNRRFDLYDIWNLKAFNRVVDYKHNFGKDLCKYICAHAFKQNIVKIVLVIHNYFMTLRLIFHKDPRFCWGDMHKIILDMHARGKYAC